MRLLFGCGILASLVFPSALAEPMPDACSGYIARIYVQSGTMATLPGFRFDGLVKCKNSTRYCIAGGLYRNENSSSIANAVLRGIDLNSTLQSATYWRRIGGPYRTAVRYLSVNSVNGTAFLEPRYGIEKGTGKGAVWNRNLYGKVSVKSLLTTLAVVVVPGNWNKVFIRSRWPRHRCKELSLGAALGQ